MSPERALEAEIAALQTELDGIQKQIHEYGRYNSSNDPWKELAFWQDKEQWEAANLPLDEIGDYKNIKREQREEIRRRERKAELEQRLRALHAERLRG